jgi:tripartite-type tricarboxylate transporter receptor subunit TctC
MAATRRTFVTTLAALGAAGLPARRASAQAYPDKTIRFVVPFAAGGNADLVGRVVADIVQRALGQPAIVENKAGAGGGTGADFVAKSAPDGYTLLIASNGPLTVNPFVNPNLSYKPLEDFIPIGLTSYIPHVLVVANRLGVKSLGEVIALSKTKPVSLATSGVGSATHMTIERFKAATGANITHVPYRSGGALMPDVVGGNVDGAMTELSIALQLHKGNQARIVGVAAAQRTRLAPDIPTFDEQGVKGFLALSFVGVAAPAGTPADAVAKLQGAIAAGLAPGSPSAEKLIATGSEIASAELLTPAGFKAFIARDYEAMREAAKLAGLGAK